MSESNWPPGNDLIARAVLTSELVEGCTLTIDGGGTTFSIGAGTLRFVTTSNVGLATVITILFPGASGLTPITANTIHFITIDKSLTVTQATVVQEYPDLEDNIQIGVAITANSTDPVIVANGINITTQNIPGALFELQRTLRPLKMEGCILDHSSANDLTINTTEGKFLFLMADRLTNPATPNTVAIPDIDYVTYFYVYRDGNGTGGLTLEVETGVQPDQYDDGSGTLVTLANNRWSIQKVTFTDSTSCVVQYGQKEYKTLADAVNGLVVDPFELLNGLIGTMFFGYMIIKKGVTDLSDTTEAIFVNPPMTNGEFNVT